MTSINGNRSQFRFVTGKEYCDSVIILEKSVEKTDLRLKILRDINEKIDLLDTDLLNIKNEKTLTQKQIEDILTLCNLCFKYYYFVPNKSFIDSIKEYFNNFF